MIVVFDTNVFVSAAISHGSARRCFVLLAKRKIQMAVTGEILAEYEMAAEELSRKPGKDNGAKWQPLFQWTKERAKIFEAVPLGKQRSRDATDDIFLACALASRAKTIVSYDHDLLALGKPFGVEILKPTVFVARFKFEK